MLPLAPCLPGKPGDPCVKETNTIPLMARCGLLDINDNSKQKRWSIHFIPGISVPTTLFAQRGIHLSGNGRLGTETISRVTHDMQHYSLDALVIINGDFNQSSLSATLPSLRQMVSYEGG